MQRSTHPFFVLPSILLAIALAAVGPEARAAGTAASLELAEEGHTSYRIVVPEEAHLGETKGAEELAHFLKEMTGATFPIVTDATAASDHELVVGRTNRKSIDDVPAELRTDNWEGFTLLREAEKLYILGNIPRGTLYGVYDFLDVELGVRFLFDEVNHVPQRSTLKVAMQSRAFGPRIERRTIWEGLGGPSVVRNRMNGVGFGIASRDLGGVKVIGPQTHTFRSLVPFDKYFDEHPEYFSQIDGVRRKTHDGLPTQICMTNPDVAGIAIGRIRGWLGSEVKANPYNKYIVSVTVNDSPWFCKCEPCVEANRAEGVKEGGTLMRFVNTIADDLREDYAVSVETMMYHTEMPMITKPASNVLIQLVSDPDWRYALDDPGVALNRKSLAFFRQMKEEMGDGYMYNWIKLGKYGSSSYLDPRPNLRYIARNIRIMTDHGVKGYFCQTVQSRGTEMQALRYYLLARAMWRPEVDSEETIREFCHLYYGAAAPDILRYIDFLHDAYGGKDRSYIEMADTTVHFDEDYIRTADRILAAAEARVLTAEEKVRVATCRLPVWKLKLDRAFGEVGKVLSLPVIWSFKPDPDDVGVTEHWESEMSFDDWNTMRIDKHWTMQGEDHRGVAWYGTQFVMPRGSEGPHAIWFGAVDGDADIFIDGVKVGEQKISATSMWQHGFYIPMESVLAPGVHTVVVRVFKPNWASGIWKGISVIDMSAPISDELREAGRRFIDVSEAAELKFLSESYGGPYTQTRKAYFPKIEYFLTHESEQ